MGTPAASDLTLAPGAGHGDEGDASFQGPAQETDQAQIETLPASPKPTNSEAVISDAPSAVIELAARTTEAAAVSRETDGLVMTRPKPEKRLNAKDRAKARRAKGKPEAAEEVAAVIPEASGFATAHPKPEKRKNAKERAKEKYASKDGTTPDTTAKAKSKVKAKAEAKKAKKSKLAA